jgi:hypothetical protein
MFLFLTTQKAKAKLARTLVPQQESVQSFSVKCYTSLALVLDMTSILLWFSLSLKQSLTPTGDDFCWTQSYSKHQVKDQSHCWNQMLTVWLTARHFILAIMSLHAITIIRLFHLPPPKKIFS